MALTEAQLQFIDYIYKETGNVFSKCFLRFLVQLPSPQIQALRVLLQNEKAKLQAKVNAKIIQTARMTKLSATLATQYNEASSLLNELRNSNAVLGIQARLTEGEDCTELTGFLNNFAGVDAGMYLDSIAYEQRRIFNSIDISQERLTMQNAKVDRIDELIGLLLYF